MSLFVVAYMLPVGSFSSVAYGQSNKVLVGSSSAIVEANPVDLVYLTPKIVEEKKPVVNITVVDSEYQKEQAAAALEAQKAALKAAQAKKITASVVNQPVADVSYDQKIATVQKAAAAFGIDWKVLAAVWKVESGMQWQTSVSSSAGAVGPCQFLPSTWRSYAIDGDGNGTKNIYQASDCLYGAAKLLASNGASSGSNVNALLHYNHSMAYVNKVLGLAKGF